MLRIGLAFLLITACAAPGNRDGQSASGAGEERVARDETALAGSKQETGRPAAGKGSSGSEPLPETSVYQLAGEWHDQRGDTLQLESLRGKIPVIAMVFTHCEFACPRIVSDMKKIQKEVSAGKADEVVFVLVSFDSERDRPERLRAYANEANLDARWLLLHGNHEDVRMLSMLLGVSYQKQAGGTFAHSNIITLLNKDGQIVSQVEGLGSDTAPIASEIAKL